MYASQRGHRAGEEGVHVPRMPACPLCLRRAGLVCWWGAGAGHATLGGLPDGAWASLPARTIFPACHSGAGSRSLEEGEEEQEEEPHTQQEEEEFTRGRSGSVVSLLVLF